MSFSSFVMYHRIRFLISLLISVASAAESQRPANVQLTLAAPLNFQVVQRLTRSEGKLVISGTLTTIEKKASAKPRPVADSLEARLTGKSVVEDLPDRWRSLPFDPRVPAFRAELTVPAGGWYRLEVRALARGTEVCRTSIEHVGVGEIFVVAGQSNAANYGEKRQTNETGMVTAFDGSSWELANDPQPGAGGKGGSFIPSFGDAMFTRFHVPIGIVPMGIGSTSVREWLPAGTRLARQPTLTHNVVTVGPDQWEATGKIFSHFSERMRQLGPHGFRAVLWHQGESDANQAIADRTLPGNLYRQYLEQLIRDTRRAIGWDAPWFVAQSSYHTPDDTGSDDIRAAQKALWDAGIAQPGPDTDALRGAMRDKAGTGVHFSSEGLIAHGRLWESKVGPWLEQTLSESSE